MSAYLPIGMGKEAKFRRIRKDAFYEHAVMRILGKLNLHVDVSALILHFMGDWVFVEVPNTRRPQVIKVNNVIRGPVGNPFKPAAGGVCHLMRLPTELLKVVFAASLPPRSKVIHPTCGKKYERHPDRRLGPNRLADLMVLNKRTRNVAALVAYQERTFSIHVHQGFKDAGIEFLHVGLQPLQYQANVNDSRFAKFSPDELFGFARLKKMEIVIFPSDNFSRHTAINAYFMNLSLVKLLHRTGNASSDRITSIRIEFALGDPQSKSGRSAIMAAENFWWDSQLDRPRETSIHCLSDIELALRPFAKLSGVHNVEIALPPKIIAHQPTLDFVQSLKTSMQATTLSSIFLDDELDNKIEAARFALEEHISMILHGGTGTQVSKITDDDLEDDKQQDLADSLDGNASDDEGEIKEEEQDLDENKRALSRDSKYEEGGGKRVHLSHDLDPFGDDEPVSSNPESDQIAQFVQWFRTTGDVARNWLELADWDLQSAASLFMDARDPYLAAAKAGASKATANPTTPSKQTSKRGSGESPDLPLLPPRTILAKRAASTGPSGVKEASSPTDRFLKTIGLSRGSPSTKGKGSGKGRKLESDDSEDEDSLFISKVRVDNAKRKAEALKAKAFNWHPEEQDHQDTQTLSSGIGDIMGRFFPPADTQTGLARIDSAGNDNRPATAPPPTYGAPRGPGGATQYRSGFRVGDIAARLRWKSKAAELQTQPSSSSSQLGSFPSITLPGADGSIFYQPSVSSPSTAVTYPSYPQIQQNADSFAATSAGNWASPLVFSQRGRQSRYPPRIPSNTAEENAEWAGVSYWGGHGSSNGAATATATAAVTSSSSSTAVPAAPVTGPIATPATLQSSGLSDGLIGIVVDDDYVDHHVDSDSDEEL